MGFYGTLKMIFYKVSRKGWVFFFFFALCAGVTSSAPASPQFLQRASRTADCAATAEDARQLEETSRGRRFQSYRVLRCYLYATLRFPPPPCSIRQLQSPRYRRCSCLVNQNAVALILPRFWVNIR